MLGVAHCPRVGVQPWSRLDPGSMDLLQHLLHLGDQSKATLQGTGGHHVRNEPPKGSGIFWWTHVSPSTVWLRVRSPDGSSISLTPLTTPNLSSGQPPSSLAQPEDHNLAPCCDGNSEIASPSFTDLAQGSSCICHHRCCYGHGTQV